MLSVDSVANPGWAVAGRIHAVVYVDSVIAASWNTSHQNAGDDNVSVATKRLSRLRLTAYREAGRAVMCMVQQRGFKLVTIVSKGESRGRVHLTPIQLYDRRRGHVYREKVKREIVIDLAGPIAQKIAQRQQQWRGTGSDMLSAHRAIELASQMYDGHDTVRAYLKYLWFETRDTLLKREHWKAVRSWRPN